MSPVEPNGGLTGAVEHRNYMAEGVGPMEIRGSRGYKYSRDVTSRSPPDDFEGSKNPPPAAA